ncbi:hypothetical protein [Haemophilus haemolyticus]|uniref:hypothetical protein n=1 Tax=Haemophilus haemolyticus TaxID=726 RepID=UPI0018656BD4|nr:hypothetical protein [Haemophilus haemolyticus]
MPPNPKIREETLELENLKFYAENAILAKLWGSTNKKQKNHNRQSIKDGLSDSDIA